MKSRTQKAVELIPVDSILVLNPRERDKGKFRDVVDSIAAVGLKRPITVSKRKGNANGDSFNLVCGQGRLEAFRELGQSRIPAIVLDLPREECFVLSLVENLARRHHSSLELMHNISVLSDNGYSVSEIVSKTGLSREYVVGVLHLIKAGEERLLAAVERGQIPVSVAVDIATAPEGGAQKALTDAYAENELRGRKLQVALRVIKSRERHGKKLNLKGIKARRAMTAQSMVRAYKRETDRQRTLIRKADLTESRLTLITSALKRLFADEHFVTLLRAEGLETLPNQLANKIKRVE